MCNNSTSHYDTLLNVAIHKWAVLVFPIRYISLFLYLHFSPVEQKNYQKLFGSRTHLYTHTQTETDSHAHTHTHMHEHSHTKKNTVYHSAHSLSSGLFMLLVRIKFPPLNISFPWKRGLTTNSQ